MPSLLPFMRCVVMVNFVSGILSKVGAQLLFLAIMAALGFVGTGVVWFWHLGATINEISAQVALNGTRLQRLENREALPRVVSRLRRGSGPVEGHCVEGTGLFGPGGCLIRMVIARVPGAEDCVIVQGQTEFYWYDPGTLIEYPATPNNSRPATNITVTGRAFLWDVPVPSDLSGSAALDFCFAPRYVRCPGMTADEEPHTPAPV